MGVGSGGLWLGIALGVIERWPGEEYRRLCGVMAAYSIGGIAGPGLGAIGGIREPFLAYLGLVVRRRASPARDRCSAPARPAASASDRAVLRAPGFAVSTAGVALVARHDRNARRRAAAALRRPPLARPRSPPSTSARRCWWRPSRSSWPGCRCVRRSSFATALIVGGLALAGAGRRRLDLGVALRASRPSGFGLGETSSLGYLLEAVGPDRMILAMVVWSQIFALGISRRPGGRRRVADCSATARSVSSRSCSRCRDRDDPAPSAAPPGCAAANRRGRRPVRRVRARARSRL